MSVYNEEKVIEEKLQSMIKNNYPSSKLQMLVGSDGSTDATNQILKNFSDQHSNFQYKNFEGRTGKSSILNQLVEIVSGKPMKGRNRVFIFTDANVMFTDETVFQLVKHFKNPDIALVGANILNKGLRKEGISIQEKSYIERENQIKYLEGLNWGTMMGAFGACYAIRSDFFGFIPENFLMEDFYITLHALARQGKAISEPNAICLEDVSDDILQEFRRKVRISAGNYQNLRVYYKLLFRFSPLAFSFMSHKVLRWMGPFFIIATFVSCLWLSRASGLYRTLLIIQSILLLVPLLDYLFRKVGVHVVLLRFISYFYFMNLALIIGLMKYLAGIKTSVWEPTKRNQG